MTLEQNPFAPPGANLTAAEPESPPAGAPFGPSGIGGWLLLPTFGLCLAPFRQVVDVVRNYKPFLAPGVLSALITPGSENYHRFWAPMLIFEAATNLAMIAFTLVLLWLFFSKSRRVPRLMIIWLAAGVVVPILDDVLGSYIPAVAAQETDKTVSFTRSFITAGIWIAYFLRSVRVKNTFVR